MSRKKILLFGGGGMLGTRIQEMLTDYAIKAPARSEVDLLQKKKIESAIEDEEPEVIAYAAGITSQVQAEKEKDLSLQLNATSPLWIARKAKLDKIPVVYFSTDAVFKCDRKDRSYVEDDTKQPFNHYGLTKSKGEEYILAESNKNTVMRISSLFSGNFDKKTDFARRVIANLSSGVKVVGIEDQIFTPTYVDKAVYALREVVGRKFSGVVHVASEDFITNLKFVELLADEFGYSKKLIEKVKHKDYFKDGIIRGQYSWLDTSKAIRELGKSAIAKNVASIKNLSSILRKNV